MADRADTALSENFHQLNPGACTRPVIVIHEPRLPTNLGQRGEGSVLKG